MRTVADAFYWSVRGLLWFLLKVLFRWRIEGREHLPATGGYIVYANHTSWFDIPVLGCSIPRKVQFMAKAELFGIPVFGPILAGLGAFPVQRHTADRSAIKHALSLLAAGGCLGIFPEGTRSKTRELLPAEPGFAYLAYKSGVPVVPMGISSPFRLFGPVLVRLGPPIRLQEWLPERPGSDELTAASHRLMAEVQSLIVPEIHKPRVASSR